MGLIACGSYLNNARRLCEEKIKEVFDSCTTDKNRTLIKASVLNVAAAIFVSYFALKTENYNPREWWSDVAVHILSALTCAAEVIIPSSTFKPISSMLATATAATIVANQARLAGIAVSVAYKTATIPGIPETIDLGNHGLTLAVLQKYGRKQETALKNE